VGGVAAAVQNQAHIVGAIDQSPNALSVYRYNFNHPTFECNLEDITEQMLADFHADLWWMSPPCQPYTVKGKREGLNDPRSASFINITKQLSYVRPKYICLENVEGFSFSPDEIARLLGFNEDFSFPPDIKLRNKWKHIGNSVSVFVVKQLLESIFQFASKKEF